jgi:hypothetical protein
MATTPLITIFVRHSAGCKYEGNELSQAMRLSQVAPMDKGRSPAKDKG